MTMSNNDNDDDDVERDDDDDELWQNEIYLPPPPRPSSFSPIRIRRLPSHYLSVFETRDVVI